MDPRVREKKEKEKREEEEDVLSEILEGLAKE